MNFAKRFILLGLFIISALLAAPGSLAAVTTGALLGEMTDLRGLSRYPSPAYQTVQFSSYDRTSKAPYSPGWFANSDGFGGEPTPNFQAVLRQPGPDGVGQYLIAGVKGPGAIVRTWTPNPDAFGGRLTVTLDGNPVPLFDGDPKGFFRFRYATLARLKEPYTEGFSQRDACYFPIPFAKELRIVWTGKIKDFHFYHVNVRKYAPGTEVRTFRPADLVTYREQIQAALEKLQPNGPMASVGRKLAIDVTLDPTSNTEILRLDQMGAIEELTLRLEARDLRQALRQTILRAYFDGSQKPQIEAPLGDFFCSAPGIVPFSSLPLTVRPDGTMTCRFVMPFRHSVILKLRNYGTGPVRAVGWARVGDEPWDPARSMHFRAQWRVSHGLLAGGDEEVCDLPFLNAGGGRGLLVGTAAFLRNPTGMATCAGSWWGEGDEKIWVDDESFPSTFGTGSEDYFNYSWSCNALFEHAYCAQPLVTGPGEGGFTVNSRFHILDPIPFRHNLSFSMELWHHTLTPDLSYGRLVYYYAEPQTHDDHPKISVRDVRQGLDYPTNLQPAALGLPEQNATFVQAEEALRRWQRHAQVVNFPLASAGKLVQWQPTAEGEKLKFTLSIPKAGEYLIIATIVQSPDSGRVSLALDDQPPSPGVVDLYVPNLTLLHNYYLEPVRLTPGKHTLTLTAQPKNPASLGSGVGVDFFWLVPL